MKYLPTRDEYGILIVDSKIGLLPKHDVSEAHRKKMRDELYGAGRTRTLPYSYIEAGALQNDHMKLEKESTHKSDYGLKFVDAKKNNMETARVAKYIKDSHFTLSRTENLSPLLFTVSTTKMDYKPIQPGAQYTQTPKEIKAGLKSYQMYTPIYVDKNENNQSKSIYQMTYKSNYEILPKEVPDILKSDKGISSASHFTFGSDEIGPSQYESLTKAHIKAHSLPPIENYGASQRKKRNTIEMIDGEKPDLRSTQKADFVMKEDIDRNSLKVDTNTFIKDIKGSHFTLGDDSDVKQESEYTHGFVNNTKPVVKSNPVRHNHSSSSIFLAEEDTDISCSTQKMDFRKHQMSAYATKDGLNKAKSLNSSTSISLGNGRESTMASITSIDYVGNYRPKNKAIKRGIPYNSLTMTDIETAEALKNKVSLTSVAKGDFKGFSPADTKRMYFEANDANANNLTFLTTHHFSYGDDNLQLKRDGTKICNNADAVVVVAPKNASRLKETSFETTLSNTITRYPGNHEGFKTVTKTAYEPNEISNKPREPKMKTQKDHVDALFAKEDANVARKISVTKSAFTHPETMISKPQRTFALSLL